MILGYEDLVLAEREGTLSVTNRLAWNAFSLDVRVGALFKRKKCLAFQVAELSLPRDVFIEKCLVQVTIPDEGIVVRPGDFYCWRPMEQIFLAKGLYGQVCSRSSWARLGIRVQSNDEDLGFEGLSQDTSCKPICSLTSTGTNVLLKKGDSVGQLIVQVPDKPYEPLSEFARLMNSGHLIILREGKPVRFDDLEIRGAPVLTMGTQIKVYSGNVLVPGALKPDDFASLFLVPHQKVFLRKGAFFLSSTAEWVSIPPTHVGYVTESNSIMTNCLFAQTGHSTFKPSDSSRHANAPYVGPKNVFSGNITLENMMRCDGYIEAGMKQTEFALVPLKSTSHFEKKSRYAGQNGTVASKL